MNKKIIISSVAVFAIVALSGCGSDAEQEAKEAQIKNELAIQKQEITDMKTSLKDEKKGLEDATEELATQTCEQKLELEKTQLTLLEAHNQALENLDKKVEKSPDFAIETCRNLNPELSKPECETKIEDYRSGKKEEYTETQEQIEIAEVEMKELTAKCGTDVSTATNL